MLFLLSEMTKLIKFGLHIVRINSGTLLLFFGRIKVKRLLSKGSE
jgi:hypothetical protein